MQIQLPGTGEVMLVSFLSDELARLATTCFRGTGVAKAGNFSRWADGNAFLADPEVSRRLRAWLGEVVRSPEFVRDMIGGRVRNFPVRIQMAFRGSVGWASTSYARLFVESDLEPSSRVNDHACARHVIVGRGHKAPRTNEVTVSGRIVPDKWRGMWSLLIGSVYPGEDISRLPWYGRVDLTRERGLVFYRWEHDGE